jgi:hypothetical protein
MEGALERLGVRACVSRAGRLRRAARWATALCLLIGSAQWAYGTEPDVEIRLARQPVQDRVALRRPSYNYAPAVIQDGAVFHLYWCAEVDRGDAILHAEASALEGPWHAAGDRGADTFDVVFRATGSRADFDGLHTCDPSVVRVGSRFYLYYGGARADDGPAAAGDPLTAIGVASSADGLHFVRLNGGRPIVMAARTNRSFAASHLNYGAGQPSAVYVPPYVYLAFTDSTGSGANPGNGAGQFAVRSRDPSFGIGVEELSVAGWVPRAFGEHTADHAFVESFGMDWTFDPLAHVLVAASDRTEGRVTLYVLDPQTLQLLGSAELAMSWREGPAVLTQSDKTMLPRAACERLVIDVFAAQGASASPWSWHALAYSEGEYLLRGLCPQKQR